MKHLIVYSHPHKESFNQAILETVTSALTAKGHEVTIRNLYQIGFNPVLSSEDTDAMRAGNIPSDIKTEQDYITNADVITFIFPIWWTGLPAIIKGYVDRVFSYGFAYVYNDQGGIDKLLAEKKGLLVNTFGTPQHIYESIGMIESLKQTSDVGIFDFCGIEVVEHFYFGGVTSVDDETRKGMLAQIEQKFSSL